MLTELYFARIIVLPIEEDQITEGGISIPSNTENTPRVGKVAQVGTGCKHDIKIGDVVLWRKDGGDELIFDNQVHLIMNEEDVIGKV